jgi:hypothetical protein
VSFGNDNGKEINNYEQLMALIYGLVVTVSGYNLIGPGFDSRRYRIF